MTVDWIGLKAECARIVPGEDHCSLPVLGFGVSMDCEYRARLSVGGSVGRVKCRFRCQRAVLHVRSTNWRGFSVHKPRARMRSPPAIAGERPGKDA